MTRYRQTMKETLQGINEKLKPSDGAGAYIKDFRKSDAPQFKGKSDKEIQKMAVAAYLDDKEENMNIGMNEKMMRGFVVRYTDKTGERLAIPYKTKDRAKEEVKALKKVGAKDIEITTHNLNFKEDEDHEISMARGELEAISDKALELSSALEGKPDVGNPLEAWVQSKITKAKDYINSVSDYLLYNPDIKMEEKAPDTADAMKRFKSGNAGFTDKAHLKAKGLIPRADGTKKVSDKYKEDIDMEEKFKPEGGELFVVTAGPGDNAQKVIGMDKNLRKAQKMRDDYDRKNRPSKPSHKARVYAQSRASQPRNKFKIGQDISYSEFGNKLQFTKVNEVAPVVMALGRTAAKAAGAAAGTAVANKVMGKEGFASDAQRRAAFAQGYKAKGKKDKKEDLDMKDKDTVKTVIKGLEKAVKTHQGQVASLKKDIQDDHVPGHKGKSKFEQLTGVPNPRTEGRKSNYATDDEDEEGANKNIIMQLYKAISLRGRFDVVFDDGKKQKVKEPIAQKAIAMHRTFKTSRDRLAFQNKISKSYRDLLNAIR